MLETNIHIMPSCRNSRVAMFAKWNETWLLWRCCGILEHSLHSHAESPGSYFTITMHFCPSARQFIYIAALDPGV